MACIIGVMLVVAVGLLIGAIRTTRDARRFGDVALQLDPFPGSIGGHFGATTVLPVAYRPGLLFAATLAACTTAPAAPPTLTTTTTPRFARTCCGKAGHGPGAAAGRWHCAELSAGCARRPAPSGAHPRRPPRLAPDAGKPQRPTLAFVRHFDVPFTPTGEASQRLVADAVQHPAAVQSRKSRLDEVATWAHPGGVDLYLPYGRTWQKPGLAGVWRDLWRLWPAGWPPGGTAAVSLVFGGVGGAFTVWAFFALGNSLKCSSARRACAPSGASWVSCFAWHRCPHSDLQGLQLVQSYTSQSGSQHRVVPDTGGAENGKTITVADSLRGEAVAEQMLQQLAQTTGLPVRSD